MDYALSRPIVIRFEGLDAANHTLEMRHLGTSLVGIGRILKNSSHFAFRHEYAKRHDKPHIRIMVRPPEERCFALEAIAIAATGYPLLQPMLADITWRLISTVTGAIFLGHSSRRNDMERLFNTIDGLIEQQGIQQEATRKDLVGIVHRLIDANQNAVRDAVRPIGKTCGSLQVGDTEAEAPIIDLATVDSIRAEGELDVDEEKTYLGTLDGLTLHTKHCRIELEGQEGKYTPGKITDPEILKDENLYTRALHERSKLRFTGKALLTKDGSVKTLYVSNAEIDRGPRQIPQS